MNKSQYWKNFTLGKELDIAGRFIYNGLQCFHLMKHFHYEEEEFEFLYSIAVGIERLLKIAIVLVEHSDEIDQEKFEKSLITHNHQQLLSRVKKKYPVKLSVVHNDFIRIIGDFYKSQRYGRYNLKVKQTTHDKINLHWFLEKHLNIKIEDDEMFNTTGNDEAIKLFVSEAIGKIVDEIYMIIEHEAHRLNIYTYEMRYGSKASKIFMFKTYHFFNEDVVWKEILIYLANCTENNALIRFIKSIEPLDLDPALMNEYLQCFASDVKKLEVMDEIESHYEELNDLQDRKEKLQLIGNPQAYFIDKEDDTDEESEDLAF